MNRGDIISKIKNIMNEVRYINHICYLPAKFGNKRKMIFDDFNEPYWFYESIPKPYGPFDINEKLLWDPSSEEWFFYRHVEEGLTNIYLELSQKFDSNLNSFIDNKVEFLKMLDNNFNGRGNTKLGVNDGIFYDHFIYHNPFIDNILQEI